MKLTPLLKQYHQIKAHHQDAILLFRMGDFYETFYDDAKVAAKVLGIALTSRPHGKGVRVPLAGVPIKSAETYIAKLVKAGHKVAVCEQVEDPRQAKTVVKRDVIEVLTPGTLMRPNLLKEGENNYLACVVRDGKTFGLALCDLSTGEFSVTEDTQQEVIDELLRIEPAELLVPESLAQEGLELGDLRVATREDYEFDEERARQCLRDHFGVVSLDGFGCEHMSAAVRAAGVVLSYLKETQKRALPHIRKISCRNLSQYLVLDRATCRNLELVRRISEEGKEGTLLGVLDRTGTSMGARILRQWILAPLREKVQIESRHEAVAELVAHGILRQAIAEILRGLPDMERLVGRISCQRANARDLLALRSALGVIPQVKDQLTEVKSQLIRKLVTALGDFQELIELIGRAIVDSPPISITDGGIIQDGFSSDLDELRQVSRSGKEWIARLQAEERKRTGIPSLKVGFNTVFGYYIEVTKPNLKLVPPDYIRKQTLTSAERFVTPGLKEQEAKVLGAEEKIKGLEHQLFCEVRDRVGQEGGRMQEAAKALGTIDVLTSLAAVAVAQNYVRPDVGEGLRIYIRGGRHPVVETLLGPGEFVPNDTSLDGEEEQIHILTGPNMSGKSTYLRQVALICIMSQMGSFVPAGEAAICLVDRIFTRVGASDDLARGVSTFLAEMNETANILNSATAESLVILDEIGRGTSTFDGLSIAWAVVEYLHNHPSSTPKTLFATHYHELTELEQLLPRVRNYNVSVKEWGDEIIFLRKVVPGGSDQSYGIQVARLAGLPDEVIARAKEVLANLESDELAPGGMPRIARGSLAPSYAVEEGGQLSLFIPTDHPVVDELKKVDIDGLTPLEALELLAELKKRHKL
jgi:DNA mismatch repair protein MutS